MNSDVSDIQVTSGKPNAHLNPPTPLINFQDFQEGLDQTKALGHKVSQEIVGVAEEGLKVISDVVQDGYSKFFNRLLTTADGALSSLANHNSRTGSPLARNARTMSAASSLAATVAEEERKRKAAEDAAAAAATSNEEKKGGLAGLVSSAGVTSNVTALNVDGTAGTAVVDRPTSYDGAMEHATRVKRKGYCHWHAVIFIPRKLDAHWLCECFFFWFY